MGQTAKRGLRTVLTVPALWGTPAFLEILLQQPVPGSASDAVARTHLHRVLHIPLLAVRLELSLFFPRGHFHIAWDTTRRHLWKALPEWFNTFVPQIANDAASRAQSKALPQFRPSPDTLQDFIISVPAAVLSLAVLAELATF